MSKPIPSVQKYMTTTPHSIGVDQTLEAASRLMQEHHIRHLPVLSGGKLLGILTDRDVRLVESFKDVDAAKMRVDEAMTTPAHWVEPTAPLDEVVSAMAEHKYGATVIM